MKHGKKKPIEKMKKIEGLLFILPWFVGFMLFMAYPIFNSLYLSFFHVQVTGTGMKRTFVGVKNYTYILYNDPAFIDSMLQNIIEMLLIIPVVIIFAFIIANLLNQSFAGRGLFRVLFILPIVFTAGFLINELLLQTAGDMQTSLSTNSGAIRLFIVKNIGGLAADVLLSLMDSFVFILWYSGVQIVIFISGLQSIGQHIYDAAKIDGATAWESFWKITLPGVKPFFFVNIIYTIVNLFTLDWNPIMQYMLDNMYKAERGLGFGAALGWLYFICIGAIITPVLLFFNTNRNAKGASRR